MKGSKESSKFQTAVEYLHDYTGVIGAVIADREGLAVASSPAGLTECDVYAALGPEIIITADRILRKLATPGCKYIALKTDDVWLTVASAAGFNLIVLADKKADDLLNVRIQRSLDMILNHVKEKYPAEVISAGSDSIKKKEAMEASNV